MIHFTKRRDHGTFPFCGNKYGHSVLRTHTLRTFKSIIHITKVKRVRLNIKLSSIQNETGHHSLEREEIDK